MRSPLSRRSLWLAWLPLAVLQCTPDERRLRALTRVDSIAEAGSSAGATGADSESFAGEGGESESAAGGASAAGSAGLAGQAAGGAAGGAAASAGAGFGGTPIVDPGGSGTLNGGGTSGGGGSSHSTGGTAGAGGAPFDSPCGDLDHDAVDDCTETLLLNSRFDTDLEHWVAGANLTQAWDARDGRSKSGSGSILVTNQAPLAAIDAWVLAGTDQCIPVTESVKYELAARVMIPDGQGLGGAGLNLYAYTGDGCSGIFLSGLATGVTLQRGAWAVVESQLVMPVAAHSVLVRLAVNKPFSQDKLSALFDDVLVRAMH